MNNFQQNKINIEKVFHVFESLALIVRDFDDCLPALALI